MFPQEIQDLLAQLAKIPYENLSKAIQMGQHGKEEQAMHDPLFLLQENKAKGTGGTCFSLTWFICHVLKAKGYQVYPVMCDRQYGKNTHCCAVLEWNGAKYLLDPGYLAFTPILLSEQKEIRLDTPYNTIILNKTDDSQYRLNTLYLKDEKYRFTLKDKPVSSEEFLKHWQYSFLQESMTYPVVTMLKGDCHFYLQKENLFIRTRQGSEQIKVPKEKLSEVLYRHFGIAEEVTKQAREIFF
ncbi:MAG: hypothetical protein A2293_10170 [Elusimicrobia bacterium RIFOXYB2_FULL_49_7]|nr:MAG: hypothetical protein A2293_10170 [Elusimicrobia bacterium RIFOXYB2_FULL_49_7]